MTDPGRIKELEAALSMLLAACQAPVSMISLAKVAMVAREILNGPGEQDKTYWAMRARLYELEEQA